MEKSIAKERDYNDKNLSILDVHNKGYIKRLSEPKKHYTQNTCLILLKFGKVKYLIITHLITQ
tara:strand:- start:839 stop:1027 length:189 start_codon:yes stop_codon:yes gene_type:complete